MVGIQESTCLAQAVWQAGSPTSRQPNRGGNNDLSELSAILPGCLIISTIMNHNSKCINESGNHTFISGLREREVYLQIKFR